MIRWFTLHPLAANLLMVCIAVSGFFALGAVKTEVIPNVEVDWLSVNVPFPGMSSQGIESQGVVQLERQIKRLKGVDDITTTIEPGFLRFQVMLSALSSGEQLRIKSDVRALLDTLERPTGAKSPSVFQVRIEPAVAALSISGSLGYGDLEVLAQRVKRDLEQLAQIGEVDFYHPREHEVVIVLQPKALALFQVTAAEVASVLRQSHQVLNVGNMQEQGWRYRVRSSVSHTGDIIGNPVIRVLPEGRQVRLEDVATIIMPEFTQGHRFNSEPAVLLAVKSAPGAGLVEVSDRLQLFQQELKQKLPSNVKLALWQDTSKYFKARIELLLENGFFGFCLLFLVLALALNWRLSFWVSLGLPVAFLGGFVVLWAFGFSVNMVSLFAFILVLGVLVDDAIIVGDSVYEAQQRWIHRYAMQPITATSKAKLDEILVAGVSQVAKPVIVAALTTVMMFVPLLFLPGDEGRMLRGIPVVVIAALAFSLIESLLILPAHLRLSAEQLQRQSKRRRYRPSNQLERLKNQFLQRVQRHCQQPWVTQALFIGLVLVLAAVLASGRVTYSFFAKIEGDLAVAQVVMEPGASEGQLNTALDLLERQALKIQAKHARDDTLPNIKHVLRKDIPQVDDVLKGQVALEMSTLGRREIAAQSVAKQWQSAIMQMPGVDAVTIHTTLNPPRDQVSFYLNSFDRESLEQAATALKGWIERQQGVQTVVLEGASLEVQIEYELNAYGESLGLTSQDLARQINALTMGESLFEVDLPSGSTSVRLALSPSGKLHSLAQLEQLPIMSSQGHYLRLQDVAVLRQIQKPVQLSRSNGRPSVRVVVKTTSDAAGDHWLKGGWRRDVQGVVAEYFSDVTFLNGLYQQEQSDIERYLMVSFLLALLAMYALMAILLKSYWLPLAVLYAVPFGVVGAVLGHWVLGISFTLYSLIGAFAVSGIVVNDNLVLLDRYQHHRSYGCHSHLQAIMKTVSQRMRAVILTTITTVVGMLPLIFESSIQSQFLKPMAVSLAFGIATATLVTLFLVPSTLAIFGQPRQRSHPRATD